VDTVSTAFPIRILGVNAATEASGNAGMCAGRTLPWLQDTDQANVWMKWQVDFRDLVILDAENKVLQIYNLTAHDLTNSANYDQLRGILLTAAAPPK
jgi:hypothetical protein